MKQLTTLVLLVLLAPAIATAQFSLAVAGETGRAWNLLVHYIPEDGGQTALQFDLLLPDGLTVEPVSETTVPDNYTVQWARQTDGNIRVVIYCGTGTTFETAKHIVFSCRLTATEDLPAGNYTVHLTGGRASAPHGAEYVLDNTAYTINVPEPVSASYRVTWLIDGQFFSEQTVEEGNALVPPAVPEREGYTFSGWQNLPEVCLPRISSCPANGLSTFTACSTILTANYTIRRKCHTAHLFNHSPLLYPKNNSVAGANCPKRCRHTMLP